MSTKTHHFRLGIFIIAAVTVITVFVIFFGAGELFQETIIMETYIDGSVQGLNIGSPVKQRGVQIGEVKQITFADLAYELNRDDQRFLEYSRYVVVVVSLKQQSFLRGQSLKDAKIMLKLQVDQGLRVRLATQDLTGNMYLEFDYLDPKKYPQLEFSWRPRNLYIPSAKSILSRITDSAEAVFSKLENTDIQGTVDKLKQVLDNINSSVEDAQTAQVSQDIRSLLEEIRQTNSNLHDIVADPRVKTLPEDLSSALKTGRRMLEQSEQDIPQVVERLHKSLARIDRIVSGQQQAIEETLQNLRHITADLKEITSDARRYPSKVLFGDAPKRVGE